MNQHPADGVSLPSLEEIELKVEVEAREFARRRLQKRLQQLADTHGGIFPSGRPSPEKVRTPPALGSEKSMDALRRFVNLTAELETNFPTSADAVGS